MPVLTATGNADLVATTIRNLGKPNFTDISSNLQKHTAMGTLLNKNRVVLDSGTGVQWDVMVGQTGAAANVGLGASDNVNDVDVMVQATADWRNSSTYYSIEGRYPDMNRDPARIVDFVRMKRIACMISLAELMEANFWGPPVSSTDSLTPWGVNMWITKNATEGFTGGAPSGYSTIGLNPTTYPNWNSYAFPYTTVSVDDFISKLTKAATFCEFEPTVDGIPSFDTGAGYGFYTNYQVYGPLKQQLTAQNDNIGTDLDAFNGKIRLRMSPVTWVPKLEADTTGPFYGIDWGNFHTYILRNWWLKETHVPVYPGFHTVEAHFMDSTYQWISKNRRTSFVGSTGTTYPS